MASPHFSEASFVLSHAVPRCLAHLFLSEAPNHGTGIDVDQARGGSKVVNGAEYIIYICIQHTKSVWDIKRPAHI